jgi:dipeptidase D
MQNKIRKLQPPGLWNHFVELANIPRCSKNEEQVRQYIRAFAAEKGFETAEDETGNLVINCPPSVGYAGAPGLILQAHMDMVCVKNRATEFDFSRDPIELILDGDMITARDTTLGADNGIGLAAALAIAESDIGHGPLQLLLTTDEETGLTGAFGLDPALIKGRMMINLDSEDFGYIYIGCAGGANTDLELFCQDRPTCSDREGWQIQLTGLLGGHSGIDIHKNRGNAITLLARFLLQAIDQFKIEIAGINGGDAKNAIPREASALVTLPSGNREQLQKLAREFIAEVDEELGTGHALEISLESTNQIQRVWQNYDARRALALLLALPSGPLAMSDEVEGLVKTSNNLGVCRSTTDLLRVENFQRSSVDSEMEAVAEQLGSIALLAGAQFESKIDFPGWKPDLDSQLLKAARHAADKSFCREFATTAIHAGLECGIIGAKIPGMQMISIGPDIRNPHSPGEYVGVDSVAKFYRFLQGIVSEIGRL